MPVLLRLADDGSSRVDAVLELPPREAVIGRGAGVEVPLIDESVSREHARVFVNGERWAALSLSEQNPIKVAGRAVEHLDLEPGTEFTLGRVRLRFELADPRDKATVVHEDDPAAAEVIAQVRAARDTTGSASSEDPASRNPFLNPQAPRPSEVATVPPAPAPEVPAPPSPTTSGPTTTATTEPAGALSNAEFSGPAHRPPTALDGGRVWPKVLLAILILAAVAAAVFHRPLLDAIGWDGAAGGGGSSDGGNDDDDDDDAGEDQGQATPVAAAGDVLAGWRSIDELDCAAVTEPTAGDSDLAKAFRDRGRPSGFGFERRGDQRVEITLDYPANGERLVFVDGAQTERNKRAVEADASPLPGRFMIGGLDADTDPRCVVAAFGPARVQLDAPAYPIADASGAVPVQWALRDGASMVTVGARLWRVRVGLGQPVAAPDHTVWVGVVHTKYDADGPRPLVLVDEGPEERRSISLRPPGSAAKIPTLAWTHPRREAPMDLVFEPGDEVDATLDGQPTDDPTYLHAQLGLIDLPAPGLQVRPFELSFQHDGTKYEFKGQLARTPWRVEPPTRAE